MADDLLQGDKVRAICGVVKPATSDQGQTRFAAVDTNGYFLINVASGVIIPVSFAPTGTKWDFNNAATGAAVYSVPASTGKTLFMIEASNPNNGVDAFLQFFDTAAAIVLGATVPTFSFIVPAGTATTRGAMDRIYTQGYAFTNAIRYAVTTSPVNAAGPGSNITVNVQLSI